MADDGKWELSREKQTSCTVKQFFERICRPHPFSKIAEKGCGLTSATKTRKNPETQGVSGAQFAWSRQLQRYIASQICLHFCPFRDKNRGSPPSSRRRRRSSASHLIFQICLLQKKKPIRLDEFLFWSCQPDLNWRPHPYQGCALPAELQQHFSRSFAIISHNYKKVNSFCEKICIFLKVIDCGDGIAKNALRQYATHPVYILHLRF